MAGFRPAIERAGLLAAALFLVATAIAAKGLQSGTAHSVGAQLTAVATTDFNVDGHIDLLVVDSPGGVTTSTVHVLLGRGDGTFQAAVNSDATPNLSAVAVGKFNSDNWPDIAVADSVLNVVTILLGNGDGTFVFAQDYPVGAAPSAIATADINHDTQLDLVVANSDDMTLSVFTGVGNGTFNTQPVISTGTHLSPGLVGVVIGDFDADLKPDVVAALNGNAVSILKGNGDGTFETATVIVIFNFPNPTAVAATDFNRDGALDLIVPTTGKVLLLAGKNNLTFETPLPFDAQSWPKAVAVGDADGDSWPDIMVANLFADSASVLLNSGMGGVIPARSYSAGALPVGIAVADFNEDNKLDVVTCATPTGPHAGVHNVFVLLGNGDGTLRAAFSYVYQTGGSSGTSQGLIVGDFTNDGWPEIAIGDASQTMESQKNRISTFTLSGSFVSSAIQSARQVSVGAGWKMVPAHMTGSGQLDIVVAGFNGIEVLPGLGDGTFDAPVLTPLASAGPRKLAVGDFDRDGKSDVVYSLVNTSSTSTARVLFGNGDGSFRAAATSLLVATPINAVAVADFNQDGRSDIAVGSINMGGSSLGDIDVFLSNGDTNFTHLAPVKVGIYPAVIVAVDVNKDGKTDLAVANTGNGNPGSFSVLMGNGDGTFQPAVTTTLPSGVVDLTVGDFDRDGFQDIAVLEGPGTVELFTNQGDGTFGAPVQHFASSAAFALVTADVNHDGAPDLIATTGDVLNVFPNEGGVLAELSSSHHPSFFREPLTFTAQVSPVLPGLPVPTGMVHFTVDGMPLSDDALSGTGAASVLVNSLSAGWHLLEATYDGDANYFPRTLPAFSQLINKADTFTSLTPSQSFVLVGAPLSLNASVTSSAGGAPTGTVALSHGGSVLGSSALVSGTADLSNVSTAQAGLYDFTATYAGDDNYVGSSSPVASVAILATPDFLISPSTQTLTIQAGQSASVTLSMVLWPGFQASGPMTFSCAGLPSLSSCSTNPTSITLSGTMVSTALTVSTTKASVSIPPGRVKPFKDFHQLEYLMLLGLVVWSNLLWVRSRRVLAECGTLSVLFACILLAYGCSGGGGGSSSGPGTGVSSPGTPTGSYTLSLSATVPTPSGPVTRQVPVTLNVTP